MAVKDHIKEREAEIEAAALICLQGIITSGKYTDTESMVERAFEFGEAFFNERQARLQKAIAKGQ